MNTTPLATRLIAAGFALAVTYGIVAGLMSMQAPQRGALWARIEHNEKARLAAATPPAEKLALAQEAPGSSRK